MQSHLINKQAARFHSLSSSRRAPCLRLLPPSAMPARAICSAQGPIIVQQPLLCQRMQQLEPRRLVCSRAASSSNDSSSAGNPKPKGSVWSWFDRLPANGQLGIMGGLLFIAMVGLPFLQPTFLYGESNKASDQHKITDVRQAGPSSDEKYKLPRYIPGASELYDFLQDNSMPKKLPDGRSESPGVIRIYMCSMIILGVFYVCSAMVSLILNGVAAILRAVGVMGPAPPKPEGEQ